MDQNKAEALRAMRYKVEACGMCEHADLNPLTDWGTCRRFTYEHGKHTGDRRPVSINRHGTCPDFTPRETAPVLLHGFVEFLTRWATTVPVRPSCTPLEAP